MNLHGFFFYGNIFFLDHKKHKILHYETTIENAAQS